MSADSIKDLEIVAHVMTIAQTHKISVSAAMDLYIKKLKVEAEQIKPSGLSLRLKESLSQEKWELLMSYVHHHPTNEELSQAYYQAKQEGKLKRVKLLVGGNFYIRNSDFVGNKYLDSGITLEAEVYDSIICQVWLSPTECEFIFIDELEFI